MKNVVIIGSGPAGLSCAYEILKNNKKNQKILSRRTQSTVGNANMLADIIYSVRIKLKHVGVTKIKQTDNQWAQIRELVPIIDEFCSYYKSFIKSAGLSEHMACLFTGRN